MQKFKLLLLAGLLFTSAVQAQNINRDKFVRDSIDNYINKALTNWRIPGAAVCIVKDGRIVLMKGYGFKELGLQTRVDQNTLFMIGSNTKAFTATALAMLQNERKLSLDDKVTKYLPQFKLDNKFAGEEAMVRDLLCHRLGFGTFQGDFTYWTSNLTREQVIEKMSHVKALYPFRTKWGYTNAAFVAAGEIIPKVAGKPWEVYLKENIFAPLGMTNTVALSRDLSLSTNKTAAHTIADGRLIAIPYPQIDNLAAAGSISSSASDMGKWVMALLTNGKVGQRQVIPEAAIKATREPQDIVGSQYHLAGFSNYQLYGLGWFIQDYANHRLVMHDGGVNGYVSSVTLVPDQNLGVVILTNSDQNALYEALRWEILDAFLKMPYRDYSTQYLNRFKTNAAAEQQADKKLRDSTLLNPRTELSSSAYEGRYFNDLYGNINVKRGDGNSLEMRFEHHPKLFATMQPLGGNRFYVTFSDPEFGKAVFPFEVRNGKVTGITVKVADFIEYTPYYFRKM